MPDILATLFVAAPVDALSKGMAVAFRDGD